MNALYGPVQHWSTPLQLGHSSYFYRPRKQKHKPLVYNTPHVAAAILRHPYAPRRNTDMDTATATTTDDPYPGAGGDVEQATRRFTQGRWSVAARKLPISRAASIDAMAARIGIPIPEMIFGDNQVVVRHDSGWSLAFDAADALDAVDKTGAQRLQVAYARDWARSRELSAVEGITDVRPYDWSYSTTYAGTETPRRLAETTAHALPLDLLRRRDPILFHDDVILYESELDDNGISILRVKVRVMPQRLLLLSRFYLRVDNVVVRVRDTRVYVDFGTDEVLREYTAREDSFDNVAARLAATRGLRPDAIMVAMRDANAVADLLPIVDARMERLDLGDGTRSVTAIPSATASAPAPAPGTSAAQTASPSTSMPPPNGVVPR